jgi:hypothetical protein
MDFFLKSLDLASAPGDLEITANEKWISVHPMVLSLVASLGLKVGAGNIKCQELTAASRNYIVRMGLLRFLGVASDIMIVEHEPAGRFIPITQIKTSNELSNFIKDMIPLCILKSSKLKRSDILSANWLAM